MHVHMITSVQCLYSQQLISYNMCTVNYSSYSQLLLIIAHRSYTRGVAAPEKKAQLAIQNVSSQLAGSYLAIHEAVLELSKCITSKIKPQINENIFKEKCGNLQNFQPLKIFLLQLQYHMIQILRRCSTMLAIATSTSTYNNNYYRDTCNIQQNNVIYVKGYQLYKNKMWLTIRSQ